MTNFRAKRTAPGVPIWDLYVDGVDRGCMTVFPGEGPMATISYLDCKRTIAAKTVHEALVGIKAAYFEMVSSYEQDAYIEDEDGTIARMRYEENLSDMYAMQHAHEEPDYY